MNFFKHFPTALYKFGDETNPDVFRNLAVFAEIIGDVRDVVTLYQDYYIQDGERPDQVSYNLYKNPTYHWTFFLINDNLRQSGWPVRNYKLNEILNHEYTDTCLTTRTPLWNKMKIGQVITGQQSGQTAQITHRNLNLGQLFVNNPNFLGTETIISPIAENQYEIADLTGVGPEYQSAHHYENGDGEWVDIDPTVGPGSLLTAVSVQDMYYAKNEKLRQIRVLKKGALPQIVNAFKSAMGDA